MEIEGDRESAAYEQSPEVGKQGRTNRPKSIAFPVVHLAILAISAYARGSTSEGTRILFRSEITYGKDPEWVTESTDRCFLL